MDVSNKATRIKLLDFSSAPMRAFHMTWFAFFLSFFAWFGIAPLMAVVREDLQLTKEQIGNTVIASVAITVLARLLIGPLCDRLGPRKVYSALMILGAIPVMGVGLSWNYESFLLFRLAIGAIGASFVVTQYHTSLMFAPNVVGTANATAAGWGNMGGGVTQMLMPLLLALILWLGADASLGWRLAMVAPGVLMLASGIAYWRLTQDSPEGNFDRLRAQRSAPDAPSGWSNFAAVSKDPRVWMLFIAYALCFGVELTVHNVAALYYFDRFHLSLKTAGLLAGSFGLLALFARALGGLWSDRIARTRGLPGRVWLLFALLFGEGLALIVFSRMSLLPLAFASMLLFGLCVHMSCGATYGLVPFINRRAVGSVAGIVGAGGNAGAVAAGFLFKVDGLDAQTAFFYLGWAVGLGAFAALAVRFSAETVEAEDQALKAALMQREALTESEAAAA